MTKRKILSHGETLCVKCEGAFRPKKKDWGIADTCADCLAGAMNGTTPATHAGYCPISSCRKLVGVLEGGKISAHVTRQGGVVCAGSGREERFTRNIKSEEQRAWEKAETEKRIAMKQTSYELSELVINSEAGSTRKIAAELDTSAAYVCVLKRAREDCAARVIDFWKSGELPFELVRQLMYLPRKDQLDHLRVYLRAALGKNKTEKGKARKATLVILKEARKAAKEAA